MGCENSAPSTTAAPAPNTTAAAAATTRPSQGNLNLEGLMGHLISGLPLSSLRSFLVVREQANGPADRCVPQGARETLLAELKGMPLYQVRVLQPRHRACRGSASYIGLPSERHLTECLPVKPLCSPDFCSRRLLLGP